MIKYILLFLLVTSPVLALEEYSFIYTDKDCDAGIMWDKEKEEIYFQDCEGTRTTKEELEKIFKERYKDE